MFCSKTKEWAPWMTFISKTGKRFSAMLKMEDDYKISFLFDNTKDEQEESVEKEMIKTAPVVSDCPICDGSSTRLSFPLSALTTRESLMMATAPSA